jgi:divalent metal cation (Fe/Co/Zn/Cd) transporter
MITTTTGRFFAVIALIGAGSFIAAVLIAGAVSNRLTVHDGLVLGIAGIVAVVAALWLYRDKRQGRRP